MTDQATPENEFADAVTTGPQVASEHTFGGQYTTRVTLHRPIERSGSLEPVRVLFLREPTAGDLRGVKLANLVQFDAGEIIPLLQRIAMPKLAPKEAEGLSLRDTLAVGNAVANFLL